jgi:hypothetical protein
VALVCPEPGGRYHNVNFTGTVGEAGFDDGDVLTLRRTSPANLVSEAERSSGACSPGIMVRSADEFFKLVRGLDAVGALDPKERDFAPLGRRQRVILLYTEDDVHVASYVRTHFDMLDKASGDLCDVYFIEDPRAVESFGFWRKFLSKGFYAAWRLLGWAHSRPYNKEDAYTIASRLGVPFDTLPCAAVLDSQGRMATDVVPLGHALTADFRQLFARFQPSADPEQTLRRWVDGSLPRGAKQRLLDMYLLRGANPQPPDPGRPVCFLSHSSADKLIVRAVAVALHSLGLDTWFDEWEMVPGDSVTAKLEDGLNAATAVVMFLSTKSLASPWVNAEMRAAMHQQIAAKKYKAIVPVLLDSCEVPLFLHDYKRIGPEATAEQIANEIERAVCAERPNATPKEG